VRDADGGEPDHLPEGLENEQRHQLNRIPKADQRDKRHRCQERGDDSFEHRQ
jgi:hypothetical protein